MAGMIESKELDKLNKKLDKIAGKLFKKVDKIPDAITQRLGEGAIDIRSTIIMSMRNTPKTGKHYKRGKKKHIASFPGNPPAIDSGELVRSIMFDVRKMEIEIGVEGGAPYAEYLETGTFKITGESITPTELIEPRPFLNPAIEKHHKEIIDDIGEGVFELIKEPLEKIK